MIELPVIDATGLNGRDCAARARLAGEIGRVCREIGFFYLAGHGLPPAFLDQVMAATRAFFALPQAQKEALKISAGSDNCGYVGLRAEALDPGNNVDDKEAFNIRVDPPWAPPARAGLWPELTGFALTMTDYFHRLLRLGVDLHRPIARDLGLADDFFEASFSQPMATLRLLHYPPASARADGGFGAGAHTDYGNLTLLLTDDAGGLEVQQHDGTWIAVPHIPGAFVCNIGDCLMRWTNDAYRSTTHRVTNPAGRDRYSMAFFLDAAADALVEAIPGCTGPGNPARYPPVRAGDYLASRFAATYGFKPPAT